jgi:hypothetical protein
MDPATIGALFLALAAAADSYEQSEQGSRLRQMLDFMVQQAALARSARKVDRHSYASSAGYILDRGRHYPVKPLTEEQRAYIERVIERSTFSFEPKQCFANAQYILLYDHDNRLTYVEGYTFGNAPIPVLHAWVVIDGDVPVELTLRDMKGDYSFDDVFTRGPMIQPLDGFVYYGVRFPPRFIIERFFELGSLMTVIDDWEHGWPELQKPRRSPID